MIAQRPEARAVLQAFLETEMGEGCRWLDADAARDQLGPAQPAMLEGVLISETDIRVESRTAVPAIARWLQNAWGVAFRWGGAVHTVGAGRVETAAGAVRAEAVVVCPGDDLSTLFPDRLTTAGIDLCKLQMLRLASPGGRLPAPIMSDLSLVRYLGYAALPEAAALKARLEVERAEQLAAGVHLIAVQGEDGGLVVGDSHAYAAARPIPSRPRLSDRLILDTFEEVFGRPAPPVLERWTGTYASGPDHCLIEAPASNVRLVVVTSGNGASTAFGLAEEVVGEIYGLKMGAAA